jgi:hypothetical protein
MRIGALVPSFHSDFRVDPATDQWPTPKFANDIDGHRACLPFPARHRQALRQTGVGMRPSRVPDKDSSHAELR